MYLVVAQLRSLVLRRRRQDELDEEIRLHLEQDVAQYVARGMSPVEARRYALRAFGGVEKTKDECRDAWGLRLVDELERSASGTRVPGPRPGAWHLGVAI